MIAAAAVLAGPEASAALLVTAAAAAVSEFPASRSLGKRFSHKRFAACNARRRFRACIMTQVR